MEFHVNLRNYREAAGLTQLQVAERLGITKSTYCNYESGKREPDVAKIKKIAKALGISADALLETGHDSKKDTAFSAGAMKLAKGYETLDAHGRAAKGYETLDAHGRAAVRVVMDEELNRMEELANLAEMEPENEPKIINIFVNPSAAGPALGETWQDCEPYELQKDDPQGAEYAVRVQGQSMEPYFPAGSIAFVNHDQMRDGDIGIFCVDGATVIKQWHYDRMLGITYLFSLNRACSANDVVITRNSGRQCVWQGRVITRQRFDLPGM